MPTETPLPEREYVWPTHCQCGALLAGSLTAHKPGCAIRAMIDEYLRKAERDAD
jgi:hypothetical protein